MESLNINQSLVEVKWLKEHLECDDLIILDATLPKAVTGNKTMKEDSKRIPGARFFDIKNVFSDTSATYPNTWPGKEAFEKEARNLGINNSSLIVVYDDHGIYSSARTWWMFKSMGHQNVAVLNGGLPAWKEAGYELEEKIIQPAQKGDFKGTYDPGFFKDYKDVLSGLDHADELVIDARAENRFKGKVEEPRKGLRSGHIPRSINLPYTDLLANGNMVDIASLKKKLYSKADVNKKITFSCGSGITACVLALGASLSGYKHISVYDGSWTEWGSIPELPIEKEELP